MGFFMRLLELIQNFLKNPDFSNTGRIYLIALASLGKDASPNDLINDDLACAESVTNLLHKLWPEIPIITGTWTLRDYLNNSNLFQKTLFPRQGSIILSATGTGNGKLKNGHVGIVGEGETIISNDSSTGMLLENYTKTSWKQKFVDFGGFKMDYYNRV